MAGGTEAALTWKHRLQNHVHETQCIIACQHCQSSMFVFLAAKELSREWHEQVWIVLALVKVQFVALHFNLSDASVEESLQVHVESGLCDYSCSVD